MFLIINVNKCSMCNSYVKYISFQLRAESLALLLGEMRGQYIQKELKDLCFIRERKKVDWRSKGREYRWIDRNIVLQKLARMHIL